MWKIEEYFTTITLLLVFENVGGNIMAQGLLGGATDYGDQSIEDIIEDITDWIDYTNKTKKFFEENIEIIRNNGYWSNNIPYDFGSVLLQSIRCFNTFIVDLEIILQAITNKRLTVKEVKLMQKIGKNSSYYDSEYGKTYNNGERWKVYGDENFKIAEQLYAEGRDYFVTLKDAGNIYARLNDYVDPVQPIVNNHLSQTISGNNNQVAGVNNGSMDQKNIISNDIENEFDKVLDELVKSEDLEAHLKTSLELLLKESKEAVVKGDIEAQTDSKSKMKGFLMAAGSNATKIFHLLGTSASIASYFSVDV